MQKQLAAQEIRDIFIEQCLIMDAWDEFRMEVIRGTEARLAMTKEDRDAHSRLLDKKSNELLHANNKAVEKVFKLFDVHVKDAEFAKEVLRPLLFNEQKSIGIKYTAAGQALRYKVFKSDAKKIIKQVKKSDHL